LPGWKTDRGRIYIMLGKPAQILRFNTIEIVPAQIWYYQGNPRYGQPSVFRLLFFQRGGSGDYKLYNPLSDGPRSLTPLTASGDLDLQDEEAFNFISNNVSKELAEAAWSCFPLRTGGGSKEMRTMALQSSILIGQVNTFPHKKVKDDYVDDFIAHKPTVDVSYSDAYIPNQNVVSILKASPEMYFVHLGIEPEVLSVDFDGDKYSTDLKLVLRVTDLKDRTIFQKELDHPVSLEKEQYKKAVRRSFHLYEMFPLIPGSYRLKLLLKNELTKEFTTLEKEVVVPEAGGLWMSPLLLSRQVDRNSPYDQLSRAFQVGKLQVYPSLNNHFTKEDCLYIFFQGLGLDPTLGEKGFVQFDFYKEGEKAYSLSLKISDFETERDFLCEFPLAKFSIGQYRVQVALVHEDEKDGPLISQGADVFVQSESLRAPWVAADLGPPAQDPMYSHILGNQFLLEGKLPEARKTLEKVFMSKPDELEYALSYSRVLLAQSEYGKTVEILSPFAKARNESFHLFFYLGKALQGIREFEEAIQCYEKALAHRGNSPDILNSIGFCYFWLGEVASACKAWEASLKISPDQEQIKKIIELVRDK
jgi:tetratricopeptide (TPR) repeat protein